MKEVMAVIRMNKVNLTKKALEEIGISSLTACKVLGRGKMTNVLSLIEDLGQQEEIAARIADGLSQGSRLIPRRLLTIVVQDQDVHNVVNALIKVNREGHSGDGKIFVLPIADAIRVRTNERGENAI